MERGQYLGLAGVLVSLLPNTVEAKVIVPRNVADFGDASEEDDD
jgi:hypothetical protein